MDPVIGILVLVWFFGSLLIAAFGINRKFGFWGYFFASLLLTPLLGTLLVIASDPKKPPKECACDCHGKQD